MSDDETMDKKPCGASNRKLNISSNLHPLSLEGNLSVNWKKWLQSFSIFLKASGLSDETDDRKVAVCLHFIGEMALDIFNTFDLDIHTVKYDVLIQKFEKYFVPKTNVTYESNNFFTRKQSEGESIEDFITDLRSLVKSCEFGQLSDRIVKDIFICNLHEKYHFVREKLLLEENLPISAERVQWLGEATKNDESMQLLKQYYKEGWPASKSEVSQLVLPYWNYRHDIHAIGDLILKGNSLVIPSKLRPDILKIIHSGHQGIEKSKSFARGVVYWPLMSHDIENLVQNCQTCLSYRSANAPEPLMSHKIATFPWEKVGIDYLQFKNQTIVVVEDYYSNYIEMANVSTTSAKTLINALKPIFSRHGIPREIMSDNGPPYNSKEFQDFLYVWGIQHSTSSPNLPRSNGLVESGVKIVKRILSKCSESGTDPYLALLQYRTTSRGSLPSPSQLLMSRTLRTQMPTTVEHLKPRVVNHSEYMLKKQQHLNRQKYYYDKKAKILPPVKEGDNILYKKSPNSRWMPGKIIKKCEEPRSFIIESPDGANYRRNRQHLLKSIGKEEKKQSSEQKIVEPAKEIKKDKKQGKRMEISGIDNSGYRTQTGRLVKPTKRFQVE